MTPALGGAARRAPGSRRSAVGMLARSALPGLALGALLAAVLFLGTGCASTGATFRSGVGDRFLEHAPYYAGKRIVGEATIGHLPLLWQRGGSQAGIFDPADGDGTGVAELAAEMNRYLDSLGVTVKLVPEGASGDALGGTAPDVYFGCHLDASGDCPERGDSVLGRRGTTMRLAVGRPSQGWVERARVVLDNAGASHALSIRLEVGQYWTRQKGLRGTKEVELGTGYTARLPWLTSLETPVSVLQITGAVLDRDGKAVRIGAEGILARRTPLVASAAGAQRLITDADVREARTLRRDDLPGRPLAWQVALRHLVAELTGRSELAVR